MLKALSDLVAQIRKVPPSHIVPVGDLDIESGAGIPFVDLNMMVNANGLEHPMVVKAFGRADGFTVLNCFVALALMLLEAISVSLGLKRHKVALRYMEFTRPEGYKDPKCTSSPGLRATSSPGRSEIPLARNISRGPSSSSSASSSPPGEPAAANNPPGGNAGPPPRTDENVSKLDLAIMGCCISLIVPVGLNIKGLTCCWEAPWKVLYGVLIILSIVSTVIGFFTAWGPTASWGKRLSPTCARFALVDAAALFVVFLAFKLGFGWAAGVAAAALVVLVLIVVWALIIES